MARIIAIANQKGGVGKSSVATNLPVFLAALGKRVLLVDMDAQANATLSLGIPPRNLPLSIYHALMGQVSPSAIIRKSQFFGYEIMPASPDLAGATVELVGVEEREFKLSQILDKVKDSYDYILIDSPPSLGLLTLNALCAADEILVPVQCEYLALEGLGQLINTVTLIQNNLKSNLQIAGAVLTMYSKTNRISREIAKEVRQNFPGYVFETVIPRQVALAEAPRFGKTIMQYAPASPASQAFRALAEELINLKTQPNTCDTPSVGE
ncbi:MAG: AAA family ATPase [Candidatus Nealsonbacteria bacterium]|nr:AAA family ATPase [Candidatus Nealsonbacteria bacterium]